MQNPISFMGANYVCREIGFVVPEGSGGLTGWWGVADQATQSAFAPIDTYPVVIKDGDVYIELD